MNNYNTYFNRRIHYIVKINFSFNKSYISTLLKLNNIDSSLFFNDLTLINNDIDLKDFYSFRSFKFIDLYEMSLLDKYKDCLLDNKQIMYNMFVDTVYSFYLKSQSEYYIDYIDFNIIKEEIDILYTELTFIMDNFNKDIVTDRFMIYDIVYLNGQDLLIILYPKNGN